MMTPSAQDALNRATWSKASARRDLDGVAEFTDDGERAAFDCVRDLARGKPILDLGVGTGRTIPILMPLTTDYRAIDYLPAMVDASRRRYPGVRVEVGDARTLTGFPDGYFGLVTFSYNGIDAVSVADRRSVLRAVRRVLAPGGLFYFSTLNMEGPGYRERPWRVRVWKTRNPVRYAWRLARSVSLAPLDLMHWLRIRDLGEHGDGYAVAPLSAHHYGLLAHFTTLARQLEALAEEGFERNAVAFEATHGRRVSPGDDTSRVDWFHIVARRPPGS